MIEKIIIKSVYIPIIGLIIGICTINNKYHDKMLLEKHAIIWLLLSNVLTCYMIIYFIL
jgi:hypothetical protein